MVKKVIIFFTFIGVVGICLNILFGANAISFIKPIRVQGTDTWLYTFDLITYKNNLNISIGTINDLALIVPTRTWITPWDLPSFFDAFGNNMAMIIDYIIMIISTLLYPLRLGAYLVTNVLTILGLDLANPTTNTQWLVNFLESLRTVQIPYI